MILHPGGMAEKKQAAKSMMKNESVNTKITGLNYRPGSISATPAGVDKCATLLNAFQGYRFAQPLANGWHPIGMLRPHFSQHLISKLSGSEPKSAKIRELSTCESILLNCNTICNIS
jgi:hypothetical protein